MLVIADEVQAGVGAPDRSSPSKAPASTPTLSAFRSRSVASAFPWRSISFDASSTLGRLESSGTFRGNNLAFATSAAMIETYWTDSTLEKATEQRGNVVHSALADLPQQYGQGAFKVRGNGLLRGIDVGDTSLPQNISKAAFERHLIVETCGAGDTTVKLLPPIVIEEDELSDGLARLADAVAQATSLR